MSNCLLCNQPLTVGNTVTVRKGLDTLVDASRIRQDSLENSFQSAKPLILHVDCRKQYTLPSALKKFEKPIRNQECGAHTSSKPLLRSQVPDFDFKKKCVICAEDADVVKEKKKPQNRRDDIRVIHTIGIKTTIVNAAHARNDDKGRIILSRVEGEFDLVAAEGRYHNRCFVSLCATSQRYSSGRPPDVQKHELFLKFCQDLENDDDCQFSLSQLFDRFNATIEDDQPYTKLYFRKKLEDHFGSRIILTQVPGCDAIFCLRETADRTLHEKWYNELRLSNQEDERMRIVETAANIIREDISSRVYDIDVYKLGRDFKENSFIPESLETFVNIVLGRNRNSVSTSRRKKAISEVIISSCRPRSYISPLLLELGVFLHRNYASRNLIDVLSSLGFSVGYNEIQRCEYSILVSEQEETHSDGFIQFAFDNADFNIRTLDGHSTFHNMGGIMCITPKTSKHTELALLRKTRLPGTSEYSGPRGRIEVLHYEKPSRSGLQRITIRDVDITRGTHIDKHLDILWATGSILTKFPTPSWNGYMQSAMQNCGKYDVSEIKILPFIDLNPNNPSCIFTAIKFAAEQCTKSGQKTCFVTFDQPLYAKATEIVASSTDLGNVVISLGGFHLLMSYLGAIGHIMSGSGLEELWNTVYAKTTITHMISGHAYSRAVRAHILTYQTLVCLLIHEKEFNMGSEDSIIQIFEMFQNGKLSVKELENNTVLHDINQLMKLQFEMAENNSRTGKLWVQYLRQVELILGFLRAERTGNWELHLNTIRHMIPHLHAAGHLSYAKSTRLYLQQMEDISLHMDHEELEKMTSAGYFTIRRSDKFWCGVSSDMAIEQGLMRSMKTSGGLTRGRGITENTLANWIHVLPKCVNICENIERFCGVHFTSSEQHTELRESRKIRDSKDYHLFLNWFHDHNPFAPRPADELVSVSTGMVADVTINCDRATEVGTKAMESLTGNNFYTVKLHRNDKIKPLSSMNKTITIRSDTVDVNTHQLFSRIVLVKNKDDFAELLQYELAPWPPALFDDVSMRKTQKSTLKTIFESEVPCVNTALKDPTYIIDGGFLLHNLVWPEKGTTYGNICVKYVTHVSSRYKNAVVVFDGYGGAPNTKYEEQRRRSSKKTSVNLKVEESLPSTTSQEEFLGNASNKMQLISLLSSKLEVAGISVLQATADADVLVVTTAISQTREVESVVVVANDTDILVLLIALANNNHAIYMLEPGNVKKPQKMFNISELQHAFKDIKDIILFLHAVSGTDTTSAIFKKGKKLVYKILSSNTNLNRKVRLFYEPSVTPDEIASVGDDFLLALYNGKKCKSLNELRYLLYCKLATSKQNKRDPFDLSSLPPTSDSGRQHFFRVYLQVQQWLGNNLDATNWGWKMKNGHLIPITCIMAPAPEELLNLISCNCKKGCQRACQCRSTGLHCSSMCGHCRGDGCSNVLLEADLLETSALLNDVDGHFEEEVT